MPATENRFAQALMDLIAASSAFQTWVSADDAAAAMAYIFDDEASAVQLAALEVNRYVVIFDLMVGRTRDAYGKTPTTKEVDAVLYFSGEIPSNKKATNGASRAWIRDSVIGVMLSVEDTTPAEASYVTMMEWQSAPGALASEIEENGGDDYAVCEVQARFR